MCFAWVFYLTGFKNLVQIIKFSQIARLFAKFIIAIGFVFLHGLLSVLLHFQAWEKIWNVCIQTQSLLWRWIDHKSQSSSSALPLCLHLFASLFFLCLSPPFSGLTSDNFLLQALSLMMFELCWKKRVIGKSWTKKKKHRLKKKKTRICENLHIVFDQAVTQSWLKVCGVGSSKTEGKQQPEVESDSRKIKATGCLFEDSELWGWTLFRGSVFCCLLEYLLRHSETCSVLFLVHYY